ncbi:unnamed protein product [Parascedosporium putredinis]|uniref:N-acetyltransferase ESCO zinc-finger domain-containing protein n=1 Tax=Parascedosporium putredinis TaxID=1442378 RepID=A0A9P1MD95_9PEZI|nr:unnamed protein product [Parascedosporium putredinis]CAI8000030.1 unnamed protein product [Parascedosporium putredinis]
MAPISIHDTSKSLLDASPSSPEFIIKKPHDESRLRPKQWQRDVTSSPAATMSASSSAANRRIIRTYSKRNASALAEPPAKRQRSESAAPMTDPTPPPPPAPAVVVPKKMAGAGQLAIDSYFSSANSSANSWARASKPSSDVARLSSGSVSDEAAPSPPSSPPMRKWTSPRRLKIRPSLTPISAEEDNKKKAVSEDEDEGSRRGALDSFFKPRIANAESKEETTSQATRRASRRNKDLPRDVVSSPPAQTPETATPVYNMPYSFYVNAAKAAAAAAAAPEPASTQRTAPGAKTVQTTLNISAKLPFKECRICDTVYNPLHPADVKLHQTRHAKATGEGTGSETRRTRTRQRLL